MTEFSDDAYWKCPYTGKLFFGGINGVIWVDPQNDRQENYKPALHFFEMKMGHETHSLYDYTDQKTGYVTIPPQHIHIFDFFCGNRLYTRGKL